MSKPSVAPAAFLPATELAGPLAEHPPAGRMRGRVCMVVGATRGIGRATALRMAEEGAGAVVISGRNQQLGNALAAELNELGAESLEEHRAIVDLIKKYSWKEVVLVGGDFLKIDHPFTKMNTAAEAAAWYKSRQFHDTYFLIKGSRSMQMEKVLS